MKSPRVVNVDKHASFPPAHQKAKDEGVFSSQCKLRRVKYLNNCIENDHKAVKRKSRFRQWYQSLSTARPTIDIMEAMRMVQKGGTVAKNYSEFQKGYFLVLATLELSS
ncbi:hypothetical protein PsalN5692_03675 (plasmid) [Piscirickettsia salmonis]|nr:hypothetical protein PsalN5692_03675 [Piscirickettsia salmonis]